MNASATKTSASTTSSETVAPTTTSTAPTFSFNVTDNHTDNTPSHVSKTDVDTDPDAGLSQIEINIDISEQDDSDADADSPVADPFEEFDNTEDDVPDGIETKPSILVSSTTAARGSKAKSSSGIYKSNHKDNDKNYHLRDNVETGQTFIFHYRTESARTAGDTFFSNFIANPQKKSEKQARIMYHCHVNYDFNASTTQVKKSELTDVSTVYCSVFVLNRLKRFKGSKLSGCFEIDTYNQDKMPSMFKDALAAKYVFDEEGELKMFGDDPSRATGYKPRGVMLCLGGEPKYIYGAGEVKNNTAYGFVRSDAGQKAQKKKLCKLCSEVD
jgi:hypothetical protein